MTKLNNVKDSLKILLVMFVFSLLFISIISYFTANDPYLKTLIANLTIISIRLLWVLLFLSLILGIGQEVIKFFEKTDKATLPAKAVFKIGNTYTCPSCQIELCEEFKFCPNCKVNLRNQCNACGKELLSGWRCCPACGTERRVV